ncbi:MAG: DUF1499 domain-containing protein [Cyanobacteria bacterium CRU_2_1]|nr:DUF1499 domain-containing protein [Cyanobacteria bacterium CRU_2_1]
MLLSGFIPLLSLLLALIIGLGNPAPLLAQPLPIAPTTEITMANKPLFSFSGKRPTNLGVKDGKLAPCSSSPNCVSSQALDSDPDHKVEIFAYSSSPSEAIAKLKSIIQNMERTKIITETDNYLYAEFTSSLMGFVDDVEFYLDPNATVIHVRSASRLGQSDLGVNRKRVEAIRVKFTALGS